MAAVAAPGTIGGGGGGWGEQLRWKPIFRGELSCKQIFFGGESQLARRQTNSLLRGA